MELHQFPLKHEKKTKKRVAGFTQRKVKITSLSWNLNITRALGQWHFSQCQKHVRGRRIRICIIRSSTVPIIDYLPLTVYVLCRIEDPKFSLVVVLNTPFIFLLLFLILIWLFPSTMTNHSVELASIYIIVLSAFGSSMLPTTCYKASVTVDDGSAQWP